MTTNVQQKSIAPKGRYTLHIEPFMIDLNLPTTELFCYAIVYNFSKDGKTVFFGGQEFLAEQIGKGRSTVNEALKSLEKRNLIRKEQRKEYGYVAIIDVGVPTVGNDDDSNENCLLQGQSGQNDSNIAINCENINKTVGVPTQNQETTVGVPNQSVGGATNVSVDRTENVGTPNFTCRQTDTNIKYNINNNINSMSSESEARTRNAPLKSTQLLKPAKKLVFAEYTTVEPPTVEQVKEFVAENGLNVNAEHFHKHYSLSGWCDKNGRRIEFWQQKLYTWHELESKNPQGTKHTQDKKTLRSDKLRRMIANLEHNNDTE